ncbi:MAG: hypothetical protein Q8N37_02990 [bacterium]|nr:hypothetical protein [bacterium]
MKQKKINRLIHAGKTLYEKDAYGRFLLSKFALNKTEEDPIDLKKTDSSSFEDKEIEKPRFQKKSALLSVKDFLYDNWIIALISGVIFLVIGGYISVYREQGVQGEKIMTIEKNIDTINKQYNDNQNNWNDLDKRFEVFRAEVSKEIEFIKKKLKL